MFSQCDPHACQHDISVKVSLLPAVGSSQMLSCLRLWITTTRSGRKDRSFHARNTPTS